MADDRSEWTSRRNIEVPGRSELSRPEGTICPSAQSTRQAKAGDKSIASPIKQIWTYIKHELLRHQSAEEEVLFAALPKAWNEIPHSGVEDFVSSFRASCII
jgi:iron-sulfur cluster repair protein YtfE (RIC family)